jgi:hypothetical protein
MSKAKYLEFCAANQEVSLFAKPWWLDTVCGPENWDVILIEKGEQIIATLPYQLRNKFGFRSIVMPNLTPHNGLFIKYPENQKIIKKLSYEKEILSEIIAKLKQLKPASYFQRFPTAFSYWLPFYWEGYAQTTQYTYVIEKNTDLNAVFDEFKDTTRQKVRKAEKIVKITEGNYTDIYELSKKIYSRQNMETFLSPELLDKLDKELAAKNCRKIILAVDKDNLVHAGAYLVWDDNCIYYLIGGGATELRGSGANNLVLWEAIKFALENNKNFDFEGSMHEPIEQFFRSFGAVPKPYFVINKNFSRTLKIIKGLRDIFR